MLGYIVVCLKFIRLRNYDWDLSTFFSDLANRILPKILMPDVLLMQSVDKQFKYGHIIPLYSRNIVELFVEDVAQYLFFTMQNRLAQ